MDKWQVPVWAERVSFEEGSGLMGSTHEKDPSEAVPCPLC